MKGKLIKARNGQQTDEYDDAGKPIWGYNSKNGKPACYSPLKDKSGQFCEITIRGDSGRCNLHNAGRVRGAGHPNAKHLKHSKSFRHLALPQRYHKRIKASLKDPDIIDLKPEIAAIDSRIDELEGSLEERNAVQTLGLIREAWTDMGKAVESKDNDAIAAAQRRLTALIIRGASDQVTWDGLLKLYEQRRKLVDSEVKRRAQVEQMIPLSVLKDYTIRLIELVRTAVVENTRTYAESTTDRIREALQTARIDPEVINVAMAAIAPPLREGFEGANRMILSDASRGVASLYSPTRAELPG